MFLTPLMINWFYCQDKLPSLRNNVFILNYYLVYYLQYKVIYIMLKFPTVFLI